MLITQFMTEWVLWKWGQAVRLEFQQNGHPGGIRKLSCKNGRKTLAEDKNYRKAAEKPSPKYGQPDLASVRQPGNVSRYRAIPS